MLTKIFAHEWMWIAFAAAVAWMIAAGSAAAAAPTPVQFAVQTSAGTNQAPVRTAIYSAADQARVKVESVRWWGWGRPYRAYYGPTYGYAPYYTYYSAPYTSYYPEPYTAYYSPSYSAYPTAVPYTTYYAPSATYYAAPYGYYYPRRAYYGPRYYYRW